MRGARFKHTELKQNLQCTALSEQLVGKYPTFNEIRHIFILFTTVTRPTNPVHNVKLHITQLNFKVYSKILLYCLNRNTDCPLSSNGYWRCSMFTCLNTSNSATDRRISWLFFWLLNFICKRWLLIRGNCSHIAQNKIGNVRRMSCCDSFS
jgi:hypothetical protein